MKPLFLDNPPRYTRTQREQVNDVNRRASYGRAWWVCMALICLATMGVML